MNSNEFFDDRERYELSPHRYAEISKMNAIKKLFEIKKNQWKKNWKTLTYADLGSGDCAGTKEFVTFLEKSTDMPIHAIGMDASKKCSSLCKKQEIDFYQVDFNNQQLPINDIQIVTLFETIEHIFNTDFLLKSIRDSMSRDGILLVTTLNVVCWKNRILVPLGIQPFNTEVSTKKLSYGYKYNFLKKKMSQWTPAGHIRPFTLNSLRDILEDNGFAIINSYGLENWRAFKILEKVAKNMCTGMLLVAKPV